MKYSEAEMGRLFVIRLQDGDRLPSAIEDFAKEKKIAGAMCILVGGVSSEGRIVSGPALEDERPVNPIIKQLAGVHEIVGAGTIFADSSGNPRLHMHASLGRGESSVTGCIRPGIEIWNVGEVILIELVNTTARRETDSSLGFELLET